MSGLAGEAGEAAPGLAEGAEQDAHAPDHGAPKERRARHGAGRRQGLVIPTQHNSPARPQERVGGLPRGGRDCGGARWRRVTCGSRGALTRARSAANQCAMSCSTSTSAASASTALCKFCHHGASLPGARAASAPGRRAGGPPHHLQSCGYAPSSSSTSAPSSSVWEGRADEVQRVKQEKGERTRLSAWEKAPSCRLLPSQAAREAVFLPSRAPGLAFRTRQHAPRRARRALEGRGTPRGAPRVARVQAGAEGGRRRLRRHGRRPPAHLRRAHLPARDGCRPDSPPRAARGVPLLCARAAARRVVRLAALRPLDRARRRGVEPLRRRTHQRHPRAQPRLHAAAPRRRRRLLSAERGARRRRRGPRARRRVGGGGGLRARGGPDARRPGAALCLRGARVPRRDRLPHGAHPLPLVVWRGALGRALRGGRRGGGRARARR